MIFFLKHFLDCLLIIADEKISSIFETNQYRVITIYNICTHILLV